MMEDMKHRILACIGKLSVEPDYTLMKARMQLAMLEKTLEYMECTRHARTTTRGVPGNDVSCPILIEDF